MSPHELAAQAADHLATVTSIARHDVALVLGSGWSGAADLLGEQVASVDAAQVPGFHAPAVPGHVASLRSIKVGDAHVLVLGARTHFYEGRGVAAVAHPVRTAAAAGCSVVVLTNGCGGINPSTPGSTVLISDHLNLTGATPLVGATFVDLTDLYSPRLRALAREVDPALPEGVYAQFGGPQFETPAEVRMARTLGADLVGMSTVLEAIAAREAGLEVLGISLVTNPAAGIGGALDHTDVLEAGRAAGPRIAALLADVVRRIVT